MDADYGRNLTATAHRPRPSSRAFSSGRRVMSRPTEDRAIVDAGLKALAFDSGPPLVWDEPAATYERASEERGRLAVGHGPQSRRFILTAWSGSTTNGG
jgi:D-serine deaminase-like pyridoxal phosphate-dependent protein